MGQPEKNGRQQVPRCARNDNFFQKLSKKGNGNGKGKGKSKGKSNGDGWRIFLRGCVIWGGWCVYTAYVRIRYGIGEHGDVGDTREIARGLRERDVAVLQMLVEEYQDRLVRYLVYVLGRRDGVDDVVQETWLRVMERGQEL